jgi:signal transduction histidine kinase
VLLLSTAVILLVATLCGVWLGRRALAPVARITEDARAITESNLSARLAVPDSRDELQQLSETLNEMLERIEQSFKRTKQFTADASHELRAPLTLIYTAAQYALRRPRTRDELVDSLNKIQAESRRTSALIDELLLLARGDAGQEATEFEHIDARALVRDAADQAREMGGTKGIHVTLELDLEELPVRGSEVKLRRLLLILVDNAIKYTAPAARSPSGRTPMTRRSRCRWRTLASGFRLSICRTSSNASGAPTRYGRAKSTARDWGCQSRDKSRNSTEPAWTFEVNRAAAVSSRCRWCGPRSAIA